ncbi:MAG: ABC transporter permease [Armatimonadota bacterium]|nr:ABC transporter permease [Armatimonadota bacterium]MDR7469546.1 ABC transporter permease [Armatimonadota bacterium]MDR7473446.1 ABC transporter permease [Armatimonadota bacterium]MDR7540245.1 ABC transporter permease [Armatimonadota bacterium]
MGVLAERKLVRPELAVALSTWQIAVRRFRRNPLSLMGLILIAGFILMAVLAPLLAPPPPNARNPYMMPHAGYSPDPQPPRPGHPFGTTEQAFDIYYGIIWGARTAFRVGLLVVAISVLIGVLVGSVAGYFRGRVDEFLMRVVDIFLAFPGLILAVVVVAILGPGLENVLIALALVSWPGYARLLRGEILSVRERDYVEAARAMGASDIKIILRHILPNSIYPVLVVSSLDMGSIVVTAAALSFLGLGAPIGYADWGQIISLSRNWIIGAGGSAFAFWYTVVFPGAALVLFTLGWNLLGDAFRDILDPRLRGAT